MKKPKVSVVIPVYNSENYLKECLDSLICQTFKEIEIICINDGSADNSLSILNEYKQKDNRVRVLNQKHSNAGAARNNGLKHVRGEYLLFLDSDDFFVDDMIEKAYYAAKIDGSIDIVIFETYLFDSITGEKKLFNGQMREECIPKHNPFKPEDIKDHLFNSFLNCTWNKLFKTEFVVKNKIEFQEISRTNDVFFTYNALMCADNIFIINEPLVYYRTGLSTNLQSTNYNDPLSFWDAYTAINNRLIKDKTKKEKYLQSLKNAIIDGIRYNVNSLIKHPIIYNYIKSFVVYNGEKNFHFLDDEDNYYYHKEDIDWYKNAIKNNSIILDNVYLDNEKQKHEIEAQKLKIEEQKQEIEAQKLKIEEQKQEIEKREFENNELKKKLELVEFKKANLEKELTTIKESTSWKITLPLRFFFGFN